jgi:hypothetical protein
LFILDRFLAFAGQPLVEHVEHFEKGQTRGNAIDVVIDQLPRLLRTALPPDSQVITASLVRHERWLLCDYL